VLLLPDFCSPMALRTAFTAGGMRINHGPAGLLSPIDTAKRTPGVQAQSSPRRTGRHAPLHFGGSPHPEQVCQKPEWQNVGSWVKCKLGPEASIESSEKITGRGLGRDASQARSRETAKKNKNNAACSRPMTRHDQCGRALHARRHDVRRGGETCRYQQHLLGRYCSSFTGCGSCHAGGRSSPGGCRFEMPVRKGGRRECEAS